MEDERLAHARVNGEPGSPKRILVRRLWTYALPPRVFMMAWRMLPSHWLVSVTMTVPCNSPAASDRDEESLHYARVNMWLALLVAGAIASAFITFVLMASEARAF